MIRYNSVHCHLIGSRYDNMNAIIPECGLVTSIVELIKLHSLDERDSPSKFRVSTPALLYKALPQSYQDVDIIITCMIWCCW